MMPMPSAATDRTSFAQVRTRPRTISDAPIMTLPLAAFKEALSLGGGLVEVGRLLAGVDAIVFSDTGLGLRRARITPG